MVAVSAQTDPARVAGFSFLLQHYAQHSANNRAAPCIAAKSPAPGAPGNVSAKE
jgi:hypothetical protein